MRRRTSPIWSRWELNPPTITLRDAARLYAGQVDALRHHGLIKPTTPATAYQCRDCGEHQAIAYMSDRDERQHGFIVCGDCGPCEVPAESIEQVVFDTEASLAHLFSGAAFDQTTCDGSPLENWSAYVRRAKPRTVVRATHRLRSAKRNRRTNHTATSDHSVHAARTFGNSPFRSGVQLGHRSRRYHRHDRP